MPTRRTFYGKRYHGRKVRRIQRAFRRYRARKRQGSSLRNQVRRLKKKVYNNLQPCWIDSVGTMTAGAGGTIFPNWCSLQDIAQGDDHDQRQGNKITVKSIQVKGQIQVAVGDVYNIYRMIIFSLTDDPAPGAPLAVSDILQTSDLYSFYKKDSNFKYKIHYDHSFKMSNALASVGTVTPTALNGCPYPNYIRFEKTFTFKNHQVHYRGPTNGPANKGGIYCLVISDSLSQVPSGHPDMTYRTRMSYDP